LIREEDSMSTREIPRNIWAQWLEELSVVEQKKPVKIETEHPKLGDQKVAEHVALRAIEFSDKGSISDAIEVIVSSSDGELTHRIEHPKHVYVLRSESGSIECLNVESDSEGRTLITFEQLAELPERN
jgi:hypothetical protein